MQSKLEQSQSTHPPKITKREDIQRRVDEERSVEIQAMRLFMRRYPDKAKESVRELFELEQQVT